MLYDQLIIHNCSSFTFTHSKMHPDMVQHSTQDPVIADWQCQIVYLIIVSTVSVSKLNVLAVSISEQNRKKYTWRKIVHNFHVSKELLINLSELDQYQVSVYQISMRYQKYLYSVFVYTHNVASTLRMKIWYPWSLIKYNNYGMG